MKVKAFIEAAIATNLYSSRASELLKWYQDKTGRTCLSNDEINTLASEIAGEACDEAATNAPAAPEQYEVDELSEGAFMAACRASCELDDECVNGKYWHNERDLKQALREAAAEVANAHEWTTVAYEWAD